jgi:hypothetical protein
MTEGQGIYRNHPEQEIADLKEMIQADEGHLATATGRAERQGFALAISENSARLRELDPSWKAQGE